MRILVTTLFLLVGAIHLWPASGLLGGARLEALYGVAFADDALLLMRHRAVAFGLIGALLVVAAFRESLRTLATVAGLVSMLSFVALALPPAAHGPDLQRVFWADVIASARRLLAWWAGRAATARRAAPPGRLPA